MKWEYPLWHVTDGVPLKVNQIIVDGKIIQAYPDNDDRLWYYSPETGKVVYVE